MSVETKSKAAMKKPATHPNTWVFYEGEFGRYHDIKLGLMTHALHYGTGCFEGIRAYWNPKQEQLHLLQAPAHYERLRRSANVMRMTVPYSTEELVNLTVELLRRNEFKSDVYVRPLLYASSEEIGVRLQPPAQLLHLRDPVWQLRRGRVRHSLHGQLVAAHSRPISAGAGKDHGFLRSIGPGEIGGC